MKGFQTEEGKALEELDKRNRAVWQAQRDPDARARGGWLFSVGLGQSPDAVAQHYSGGKRGALDELLALNPAQEAGPCNVCDDCNAQRASVLKQEPKCKRPVARWARWFVGAGILLPYEWGDPDLRRPLVGRPGATLARRNHASAQSSGAKKERAA